MSKNSDLAQLALKLVKEGPHKIEPGRRHVRGLFNGKYCIDSKNAFFVWEHPYYPQFYIPISEFTSDARLEKLENVEGTGVAAYLGRLTVGNRSTDRVLIFNTPALENVVKVEFGALDQWFEEDVPIYCHPKDPYKRIDILHSTRNLKVEVDGVTLAETSKPLHLLETSLRTRYYLPPTSVKWEYLSPSNLTTLCPYKGQAEYYHVTIDGKKYENLVWYYRYPTMESAQVAGHLCFYNEKVDTWVDGVKEQR